MKLKVKMTYFDRVEDRYIFLEKEPTIEREEKRAKQLIAAGVVEELVEEAPAEAPVEEALVERPKSKRTSKAKKTE